MLKRLARDESGVALGLAIIMVVLIGVMGAGLLVFVNTDLQNVIQVNSGQKAFNAADAGIQAAKRQLLSDAVPEHYGRGSDASKNIDWSYKTVTGGEKSYDQMKQLNFNGNTIKVSIEHLQPVTAPATPTKDQAPEVIPAGQSKLSSGCNYFRVRSYGESGPSKRGIESIYCASALDLPTAYYTPNDIEFDGNVSISGVSFFARGNIYVSDKILGQINRCNTTPLTTGCPALYGDWDTTHFNPPSKLNTAPRKDSAGKPIVGAGLAAEGMICNGPSKCSTVSDSVADGYNDYDSTTGLKGQHLKFCKKPASLSSMPLCSTTATVKDANPPNTISYPFNPSSNIDLDFLKEEANRNGTYYSSRTDIDNAQYPSNSSGRTVVYVNAHGGTVDYRASYNPKAQGIIVVENGDMTINNSSTGFKGIVIVTAGKGAAGTYDNKGNNTVEGFVVADGKMTIRGTVAPLSVNEDFTNRPGFYGVNLWSWRELYQ